MRATRSQDGQQMLSEVPGNALPQCASDVMLVRPAAFGFNAETAVTNAFQQASTSGTSGATVSSEAREEFGALERALASEGIDCCVLEDEAPPLRPDAVFPNNWVSFHADGTVVLYPMAVPSRRLERRPEWIARICERAGFVERRRLDLSGEEGSGRFLEGTGSLVLDHSQRRAYACRSPRTDAALVAEWARLMDYEPVIFDAVDESGRAYYHTNVLIWIGARASCACLEAVASPDRERVRDLLSRGRDLFEISRSQVRAFAGNMLQLASWDEALGDCEVLVMSATARAALTETQWRRLGAVTDNRLVIPVPTIERVGGGSVRCMIAEVPRSEVRP
jgi:hypothetical protein